MRILIADDDEISLMALQAALDRRGHVVVAAVDGNQAWEILQKPDAPSLAILDWMMPGISGLDLCRMMRACNQSAYIILLTANCEQADIVRGFEAGADDYITKPFKAPELNARLQAGVRIEQLQQNLKSRVGELEAALVKVKQLSGLLPICCYCKSIRDDKNYWQRVEDYVSANADVRFSHGICPRCFENVVKPELARLE